MSGAGVHAAIHAVMSAFGSEGLSKDKINQQQGFQYRGIDDLMTALSPKLVAAGLIISPFVVSRQCETRETASGKKTYVVSLQMNYQLTAVSDGSTLMCSVFGEAMDQADKATNKAMSVAYKYLCFQLFCIPLEATDDPDADGDAGSDAAPKRAGPIPEARLRWHDKQITSTRTLEDLDAAKLAAKAECELHGARTEYDVLVGRAKKHAAWIKAQQPQQ
jgi:hypothetical protein